MQQFRKRPKGKSSSHLLLTDYGYYWRIRVPDDIQHVVGLREMRYSLRTHSPKEAGERSRLITGRTQRLFKVIRKDISTMGYTELTEDKIKELVRLYVEDGLTSLEDYRLNHQPTPMTEAQLQADYDSSGWVADEAADALGRRNIKIVVEAVDDLLKAQGIIIDGPTHRKLSLEILKAYKALAEYEHKSIYPGHHEGKAEDILKPYLTDRRMSQPIETASSETTSETIENVITAWWKEASPAWKVRTEVEYRRGVDKFMAFLLSNGQGPNTQIHTIDYPLVRSYKSILMQKPKKGKPLSFSSVDKYLGVIKAMFNWSIRNNHITINPVQGLQIGKKATKKRPDELQDIFDTDDMRKLFLSSSYLNDTFKHPWQYWVPLVGLFTGARLEEICQLYVDDLKLIDGVWSIDINEHREDQSVKTHERRVVPIHPFLLEDLGFLSYVQSLPKDGRLFPTLKRIKHRYSHYVTKWFSEYRHQVGIEAESRRKTFHSFRHTLTTSLAVADVPDFIISQVVGHATQGQTTNRYIKPFNPGHLLEKAIDKLSYVKDIGLDALSSPQNDYLA